MAEEDRLVAPALILTLKSVRPDSGTPEPHTLLVPTETFWRRWKLTRKALLESDLLDIPAFGMGFACSDCRVVGNDGHWKTPTSFLNHVVAKAGHTLFKDKDCGAVGVLRDAFFSAAWESDFRVTAHLEAGSAIFKVWSDKQLGAWFTTPLVLTSPEITATG